MSQLSNHPYPKNTDSDSVLKSEAPPVNGIGQSNNTQYSQNGIQSPHLAGKNFHSIYNYNCAINLKKN